MDDGGFVIVLMFFAIVGVAIALYVVYTQQAETRRRFEHLAKRFGGVVEDQGLFGSSAVRFSYQGATVRIRHTASGQKDHSMFTEFRIAWSDTSIRLNIRPERTLDVVSKFLGVQDIEIGSAGFDARYLIGGNHPERVRAFLTPGVQHSVDALYRFSGVDHVFLSIQGGYLEVKKLGKIRDYYPLEQFVNLCIDLVDQALATGMKGIEFVAASETAASKEVICQVCGEAMRRSEVVYCRSCRTPHHEDCWNYFGACSTFGCGQKVYKRPKLRSRKNAS